MTLSPPMHAFARLIDHDDSVAPALRWQGCSPALLQTALGERGIPFADPFPGGTINPDNQVFSGAHRTTGSSSSRKKKAGECKFPSPDGE